MLVLRFWRYFRVGLLLFVFVGLGFYLLLTTRWSRIFGPAPDYAAIVKEGDPAVAAIYRFRANTRLWPEYIDDLIPDYLARPLPAKWYYTVTAEGPSLATSITDPHTHVGYLFDAAHPEWRVFGGEDLRTLRSDVASATTLPALPSEQDRIAHELAELDRRIAREPTLIEHRRDKAAVLVSLKRLPEARDVIDRAAADFPDNFWPRLAIAGLDPTPDAIAHFAQWTTDHPSFTHDYYLALLYRQTNDAAHALATITHAVTQPIEVNPDDPNILPFYLWDMTRYTLQKNQFALVLELTNAWQKASLAHTIEENAHLPLRAAANLALGNTEAAKSDLTLLDSLKTPTWAQNISALQTAVSTNNRSFTYNPGSKPPPFDIFPLPQ